MKAQRRRTRNHLILAGALAMSLVTGSAALTNAAWVDDEHVHGSVGTDGKCEQNSGSPGIASARQLSGTLLDSSLDDIASVAGVYVANDGEGTSTPSPGATRINDSTFMAPLDVDVARNDILRISPALDLPVGSADGYSQWSQTLNNGNTTAAAGLVTDSGGAVSIGEPQNPADPPQMATLDLGALLPSALAGMTVEVGAVSSLARLTKCGDLGNGWLGPLEQPLLDRSYRIAALDLTAGLPEVSTAASGAASLLLELEKTGLAAALDEMEVSISTGLDLVAAPLLGTVTPGTETAVLMTPPDLAPVAALLTSTMTDETGLLTVDFKRGTIRIDLAKTAGGLNGLNGMAPNSMLLLNQKMAGQLSEALAQVLEDWQGNVTAALVAAFRATSVKVTSTVHGLADITLELGPANTGQLLDLYHQVPGTPAVPVKTSVSLLGQTELAAELAAALPGLTGSALQEHVMDGLVGGLQSSVAALAGPIGPSLAANLDVLNGHLSIMVNVQPDQAGHPQPSGSSPYSVSALRLTLSDPALLDLPLATSAVG